MKVYTISPDLPFADILAAGLLERAGPDPLRLASFTVLLPTKRAIRALKEAFLRRIGEAGGERALLLPRLHALGDLDEDELVLAGDLDASLAPAIDPLRRRLLLARLVMAARKDLAWDQAALLAGELARFLDQMQTQGVSLARLKDLAPADHADHWGEVLKFLGILAEAWPAVLEGEKALDPAQRRNLLLAAQAKAWRDRPPAGPVVAAGSTGSVPAAADLLKTVAGLEQGAVVLPGLDRWLDDAAWADIDETHPQFGMKNLLAHFGVERDAVGDWMDAAVSRTPKPRLRLICEAFRPAQHSDAWLRMEPLPKQALEDFGYVEAPDSRSEALAIALLMREAADKPKRTAALVTPDRNLARRVAAELLRFGVEIDDSAGTPLAQTPPGVFLRLIAEAVRQEFAPVALLSLLKHPLCGLGLAPAQLRHLARELEIAELRGPRPAPGLAAIGKGRAWIEQLADLSASLSDLLARPAVGLDDLVKSHLGLAENLAATDEETGAARLWRGEAGEACVSFLSGLLASCRGVGEMPGGVYPAFLEILMADAPVRPLYGRHPRLHIWGPLEARLQKADLLILGGMNEGVWPAEPPADPWLSRPMRKELGLDSPERRIGMAAHDAAQAMAARRVVITRSAKEGGAPTEPSRFLQRLETAMRAAGLQDAAGGEAWRLQEPLDWVDLIDRAEKQAPPGPPKPCPPVEARPTGLSVTRIETWMRDPYALYAMKILRLKALKPLDADPEASDYGNLIHKTLELYVEKWPDRAPPDVAAQLLALGETVFAAEMDRPGVWAFWWPRFLSVVDFIAKLEKERASFVRQRFAERTGKLLVDGFELSAKADRIDLLNDGTLSLVDYKTGKPPSLKQVKAGFAPQLPLEAAMLAAGAFDGLPKGVVSELAFWRLSGGKSGGLLQNVNADIAQLAAEAMEGLRALVRVYRDASAPYPACPTPGMAPDWSDYVHLERRQEWQSEEEAS